MEFLTRLFITHGAAQACVALAATIALGILLGRVKIFSISFGIGGILFSGIILGSFGISLNTGVLTFAREFGLILFVFGIGLSVGPTFLESLRDQGLKMNLMAVYIVACGTILAICCYYIFGLSVPQTAGILCGSVTNTPSLGSANEAWSMVAGSPQTVADGLKTIGQAYAVCYPFGIFGIILTMLILKALFHIDVDSEIARAVKDRPASQPSPKEEGAQTFLVTNMKLARSDLQNLIPANVKVLSIERGRELFPYNGAWRLRLEDRINAAGKDQAALAAFAKTLGNDKAQLTHPQMLAIFTGILVGVFLGSIPVFVPGLPTPVKLGVAGGTLIMGIILGRMQKCCGLTFYMTPGANTFMREIGIQLFLGCVGLNAGEGFVETITHGPGLYWMAMGSIITFVPLFSAAIFCRAVWKINFPAICGMLSGCETQPATLAFAMQNYGGHIPAEAYSTVYPLTMIMRILAGQLLVLLLF